MSRTSKRRDKHRLSKAFNSVAPSDSNTTSVDMITSVPACKTKAIYSKKLMAIVLLAVSCTTPVFANYGGFIVHDNSVAISTSDSHPYARVVVTNHEGVVKITASTLFGSIGSCNKGTTSLQNVNGVYVMMLTTGNDYQCSTSPVTIAGKTYMLKEFKEESVVNWGEYKYNTTGFKIAIDKLSKQDIK